jgi:hypothetical protein
MKKLTYLAFQILFYRGSHVRQEAYTPLLNAISVRTNNTVSIYNYSMCHRHTYHEPSILIGHSFGGYFSLLDATHDDAEKNNNIKGVVLLNSHFNSMGKALYPRVSQEKLFTLPVLTLLGSKDQRLPLRTALWDLMEMKEKMIANKFYRIDHHRGHFTGIAVADKPAPTTQEIDSLAAVISDFIIDLKEKNKTSSFPRTHRNTQYTHANYTYSFFSLLPNTIDFNKSLNIYDMLSKIVLLPQLWEALHFTLFLAFKPTQFSNGMFHDDDSVYLKTSNVSPEEMIKAYEAFLGMTDIVPRASVVTLPTVHPSVLLWLGWKPSVKKNGHYQAIVFPINNSTIYYKFPSPYRFQRETLNI